MRRMPIYSRRAGPDPARPPAALSGGVDAPPPQPASAPSREAVKAAAPPVSRQPRGRPGWLAARPRLAQTLAMLLIGLVTGLGAAWSLQQWQGVPRALTQKDIDAAVLHTLAEVPLPSPAAKAYEKIGPSVVRVLGLNTEADAPLPPAGTVPPRARPGSPADDPPSVGSGVVILENGTILTNLHVVQGARRLKVEFANGDTSDADLIRIDGANDLAVIRASKLPDDLQPATLRSASDLRAGDGVVAVGFPFGIGPSVSSGVVSGLKREFRSPRGNSSLSNLIQFDAAANPGNSGGPLVTMDGEVVGIVTAILNPTEARTFIGIGFAVPIDSAAAAVGIPPF